MTLIYRVIVVLIAIIGINSNVSAQCEPVLRNDSTQWMFNGAVNASAKVGNTLYVGGNFTRMSKSIGGLVNIDAITANPLNLGSWPRVNGTVNVVIQDGLGGFIIGGNFSQVGTQTRNRIAQITATGSVTSWNPNADNNVTALFRSGATVYVGGDFTTIGGQSRTRIAALDLFTGLATTWNPTSNGAINTITVVGTTLYAGGGFTNIGGQTRNNIAALSTTTGLATSWDPAANGVVRSIVISGTTAYVGGSFSNIGGQNRNFAAALNTTTGLATTWTPAPNSLVYDLAINGSNILVAGLFSSIGSQSRNGVAEVDANLGNATSVNYQLPSGAQVFKIRSFNNDLYVAGLFTLATGQANLIKINKALMTTIAWECNVGPNAVTALEVNTGGTRVLAGGNINTYYKNRGRIAAIDFITDSLMAWAPTVNGAVNAIAANASTVYFGGSFTNVSGTARTNMAAADASTGALIAWTPTPNSSVSAMALNGNTLYTGGAFTTISATSRGRGAAYDITTNALINWNPQFNNSVSAITVGSSEVYYGGLFTLSGSTTRNRIASFDLTTNVLSGWNPNADGTVSALAISGSNIYVGGAFNNIGGQFRPRLAEISLAAGTASTWQPYPNAALSTVAADGGRVFAGGAYTNNGGAARNNLSSVEIGSGNATSWNPNPDASINYIGIHSGRMIVSGPFASISGVGYAQVAQYNLAETAPTVTIMGKSVVCASTSTTYTAFTDVAGASYQWKRNGLNVGSNSSTYTVAPANNDQIQVVITTPIGSCYTSATATSNTITVSVATATMPTASVSGNTTICAGTLTTYTATTNVPNPTYVWRVNGNPTGTGGPTFSYIPSNGDAINVQVITPANGCFSTSAITSSSLFLTVNAPVAPTINISTANTTICAGASVTFNSTSNVTGGTYQWRLNSANITGATANNYTTTTLANNDVITAVVTIPVGGCFTASTATSNGVTMTVNPIITATLTIAGNTTPCASAVATYTATTNVTSPTYQWKRNNVNVGGNSATLNIIPATGDVITCTVTPPNGTCYSPSPVVSNSLTINPQSIVAPTATVAGNTSVCSGTSTTYTVTTNIVNGTYQWKVNGINVGTSTTTMTYIPANNDVVSCVVTVPVGQGCYSAGSATSNNLVITVNNPLTPAITVATVPAGNTTVCSGIPVNYEVTSTNVTGGTYQWKRNGFNIFGATNNTLTIIPFNNDVITCQVTIPSGACFTPSTGTSNGITMTVAPSITPSIGIIASTNNVCAGTSVTYTASTNITGGSYQWKVNSANVGTNFNSYTYTPANGDIVSCVITVPSTGCFTANTATSNSITMQIDAPVMPSVSVSPTATTVCAGTSVTFTATPNLSNVFYLWKVNSTNMGNTSTLTYSPANNDIVLCIITTPPGCFVTTTASSTAIVMKVNAPAAHTFEIGAPGIAAEGSTVTVGANVQANVGPYTIEWKNKGVTFATTNTNTATYTKAAGIDTITAVVTPVDNCFATTTSAEVYVYAVGTDINDISKQHISVYPNPFNDMIKVSGLKKGDRVSILDITGRQLMNWSVETDKPEHTFRISDLPGGSYMFRIHGSDNVIKANKTLQKL